jgi:hypothetical protein
MVSQREKDKKEKAYINEDQTSEQTFPRVLRVIFITGVQKNGPLIAWDNHFPVSQSLFGSSMRLASINVWRVAYDSLRVQPVHSRGTEQRACAFMVETAIHFYVTRKRGIESLSRGNYPVEYGALEAFGIVRSSARHAALELLGN